MVGHIFKIMLFGLTSVPYFSSAMIKNMKDEWVNVFNARLQELSHIGREELVVSATTYIYIGDKRIVSSTRIIIDNILLWSNDVHTLLIYLECIWKVSRKYRLSFRLTDNT